jgi:hypothetical protein
MAFEKDRKTNRSQENTFQHKLRHVPADPRSAIAGGGSEACGRRMAAAAAAESASASGRWAAPAVDLDWGCERARGGKRRRLEERRGCRTGKSICKERARARARGREGRGGGAARKMFPAAGCFENFVS